MSAQKGTTNVVSCTQHKASKAPCSAPDDSNGFYIEAIWVKLPGKLEGQGTGSLVTSVI